VRLGGEGVFLSLELKTITAGLQGKVRYLKESSERPNTPHPKTSSAYRYFETEPGLVMRFSKPGLNYESSIRIDS
jgi:hypothetical protein